MIFEYMLGMGEGLFSWLMTLIPTFPKEVVVTANDFTGPLAGGIASLGVWLPWSPLAQMMPVVLTFYFAAMFARFFRAIIGHIPLIGGNG